MCFVILAGIDESPRGLGNKTRQVSPERDAQVITFVGSEEADVLHAAGDWQNEHHSAVVIGINWCGDFLSPHEDDDGGDPPRHRMNLTVSI